MVMENSFSELELIMTELNEKHRMKGEYEGIVSQLEEVEQNITHYAKELQETYDMLFFLNLQNL